MQIKKREFVAIILISLLLFISAYIWEKVSRLDSYIWLIPLTTFILLILFLELIRRLYQRIKKDSWEHYRQTESLQALYHLIKPSRELPSMRNWAVSPDFALYIARTITDLQPKKILELGSGVSTLIIAYAIRSIQNSQLFSLEDEVDYLNSTLSLLQSHKLPEKVRLTHAPLKSMLFGGKSWKWYDTSLDHLDHIGKVDLCIIDGPPKDIQPLSRYPALNWVLPFMRKKGVILVDDAGRDDMPQVISRWQKEHPELHFHFEPLEKGLCLIRC